MALADTTDVAEKKPTEVQKPPERKEKLHTKVIIRRLPPTMDQETFLNQISPVPPYDYFYMVKGDASLGENSFARAYINFTNPSDIYDFKEKFDNYVFLDSAGHEYPAVVEFASFQKIPKKRNKTRVDPKCNTIETDSYYLDFVEMINKPPEPDEKPEYTYQLSSETNAKNDTTTPLLEFLKKKRAEKMRIREERREERKRKEFERKKFRDDERRKRFDEKSPNKTVKVVSSPKEKIETDFEKSETSEVAQVEKTKSIEKIEKDDSVKFEKTLHFKNRDKKFDDKKREPKPKFQKKEYIERREFKQSRRDDYRERDYRHKYDDYKKENDTKIQKKVKKYSERREERKQEALKKLEQQKSDTGVKSNTESLVEETNKGSSSAVSEKKSPKDDNKEESKTAFEQKVETTEKSGDSSSNRKETDNQTQKRIRNKDRPTIAIYRPGMLSKRKQVDGDGDKEVKKD